MSRYICDDLKVDVLFLLESWLSPDLLHKLCFISSEYIMYGVSAMESAICSKTFIGRPFRGVATLIPSSHKHHITNHICCERYNIISIG